MQPDDFTVVAGMANGLVSMQHRQTPAEARALLPASEQSRKERQKVFIPCSFQLEICIKFESFLSNSD